MKTFLFLCATLALAACKKEEAVPSGPNTFSCKINGQRFVPDYKPPLFTVNPPKSLSANIVYNGKGIHIQAKSKLDDLEIYLAVAQSLKTYGVGYSRMYSPYSSNPSVHPVNPNNYATCTRYKQPIQSVTNPDSLGSIKYYTTQRDTGTVTITRYDKAAQVAEGTFSFTARASNGQLVTITDGRFNVPLE